MNSHLRQLHLRHAAGYIELGELLADADAPVPENARTPLRRALGELAELPEASRSGPVASLLEGGLTRFRDGLVKPAAADLHMIRPCKEQGRVIMTNAGASLVDLGDGVIAVEFHSKMNAIGGDTVQMLHAGVKEAAKNGQALVVGNDAPNFSAGANLMLVLL